MKPISNFDSVLIFMNAMGQVVPGAAQFPAKQTVDLRLSLIREEVDELAQAIQDRDLVGVADAIADILYVTYGAAGAFGMDADRLFAEVHRSNMSKLGPDGKPIYREDGKVMKPPTYSPPDLKPLISTRVYKGARRSIPELSRMAEDICRSYGCSLENVRNGNIRNRIARKIRYEVTVTAYSTGKYSFPDIGGVLNLNHTTVVYYYGKYRETINERQASDDGQANNEIVERVAGFSQ